MSKKDIVLVDFAKDVVKAAEIKGVKYLGGCCGANAQYIAALKRELERE